MDIRCLIDVQYDMSLKYRSKCFITLKGTNCTLPDGHFEKNVYSVMPDAIIFRNAKLTLQRLAQYSHI